MDLAMEKDCAVMEEFFQQIVVDMKNSFPIWEDFLTKAGRLHIALRTTSTCTSAFLESFQKLADMAVGTRGSTREIGSALTRLCLRHRSIDSKLKTFSSAIMDTMVSPLQERLDEWKRMVITLDREHARESKKLHQEIRKAASEVVRLQKKAKKGKSDVIDQLDHAVHDANEKLGSLHNMERQSVRSALIEERSRLCLFVSGLKPVMDEELSMLSEVNHIQEIVQSLCMVSNDPECLPPSTEHLLADLLKTHTTAAPSESTDSQQKAGLSSNSSTPVESRSLLNSESGSNMSPGNTSMYQRSYSMPVSSAATHSVGVLVEAVRQSQQPFVNSTEATAMLTAKHASETGDAYDDPVSATVPSHSAATSTPSGGHRPHTISSAYERSGHSRPALSADTFSPPQSTYVQGRPPSMHRTMNPPSSSSNASPYAVPCIVPKRRDTSFTGGVKVADIYARPSLSGARTNSARVLPVATPTVPDMPDVGSSYPIAEAISAGIPVAGYVNMNQLAHLALQQQQYFGHDKKESGDCGDGEGYPDMRIQQLLTSTGQPVMYASAYQMERTTNAHNYDSRSLAARLELACRLQPANGFSTLSNSPLTSGYCTLPRRPVSTSHDSSHCMSAASTSDLPTLYASKRTSDRLPTSEGGYRSASLSRAFSVTGVPPSGRHMAASFEADHHRGGRPRSSVAQSSEADTAAFSYERESPVL